jgi:hypothetical protein
VSLPAEVDPSLPDKPKNPAYRVWRDLAPEVRSERLQNVIARVVNDEKLVDIAKDFGLSRSALNMALLEYAEADWQRAQVARALSELEQATDERETAADALTLARARDREKSAQWKLERLLRRLFGQEAQINVAQIAVQIGVQLRDDSTQVVDPA